mmetsp:Transcript_31229/g.82719  ORF Transcript_31229/g.82719 Transcript_31229/m.82719 type:complete len:199 (+) Transcript_31229:171-767(+)|eukprot:CAMPEP_0119542822 /NCGR_PEP_ID=MMETSP1344-20130328/53800_1 /TAXON_ID=236787 /ORGANISM="Florenciella parvula, Strain CCMP2471" /LENGTH=198 /DNA_ID=CAMNT_0007587085 /DNA_START=86 /DNA_END=682 /DNA_ORIENTATION=-
MRAASTLLAFLAITLGAGAYVMRTGAPNRGGAFISTGILMTRPPPVSAASKGALAMMSRGSVLTAMPATTVEAPTTSRGHDGSSGMDDDALRRWRRMHDAVEQGSGMNRRYVAKTTDFYTEGYSFLMIYADASQGSTLRGRLREGQVVVATGPNIRDADGNEWVAHDCGGYSLRASPTAPFNMWLVPWDPEEDDVGCS